jgi:hypothetical protein
MFSRFSFAGRGFKFWQLDYAVKALPLKRLRALQRPKALTA